MKIHPFNRSVKRSKGLTLVELLVVVTVLGILAAMGFYTAQGVVKSSRETKLTADVATLNKAIRTYEAAGGKMDGVTDAQVVINRLKTKLTGDAKRQNASAIRDTLVDPGMKANMLNGTPSQDGSRAVWNTATRSFVVYNDNGNQGIGSFSIDSELAKVDYGDDTDRKTANNLALTKNWVWDDTAPTVETRSRTLITRQGTVTEPTTTGGGTLLVLDAPTFSRLGGRQSLTNFPITNLTLTNPNVGIPSEIFYSIDSGEYIAYEGTPIVVDAGQVVRAMVYSLKPDRYSDSQESTQTYLTDAVPLQASLAFSKPGYNYFEMGGTPASTANVMTPPSGNLLLTTPSVNIPARYQASTYFNAVWTKDNTDPLAAGNTVITGPAFSNGYPGTGIQVPLSLGDFTSVTNGTLVVKYALKSTNSNILVSSQTTSVNVNQVKLPLTAPNIVAVGRDTTITTPQSLATLPVGYRIYYTTDGQDPGDSNGEPLRGTLYTTTFQPPGVLGTTVKVIARVYPPTTAKAWFTPSLSKSEDIRLLQAEDFFVGGSFFHPTGTPKRNIARILGAGLVDNSFDTGSGTSADSLVGVVRRATSGAGVYAGGDFSAVNAANRAAFVRLNANGSVDTAFDAKLSNN
jgi:prepilin-type N-terminal cleavage/methylation domain-containing protein